MKSYKKYYNRSKIVKKEQKTYFFTNEMSNKENQHNKGVNNKFPFIQYCLISTNILCSIAGLVGLLLFLKNGIYKIDTSGSTENLSASSILGSIIIFNLWVFLLNSWKLYNKMAHRTVSTYIVSILQLAIYYTFSQNTLPRLLKSHTDVQINGRDCIEMQSGVKLIRLWTEREITERIHSKMHMGGELIIPKEEYTNLMNQCKGLSMENALRKVEKAITEHLQRMNTTSTNTSNYMEKIGCLFTSEYYFIGPLTILVVFTIFTGVIFYWPTKIEYESKSTLNAEVQLTKKFETFINETEQRWRTNDQDLLELHDEIDKTKIVLYIYGKENKEQIENVKKGMSGIREELDSISTLVMEKIV